MKQQPQSLQQYQQSFRRSVENELQRQQTQNTPNKELSADDRTLIQKMTASVMDSVAQGIENSKQYGKDVITGKKAWQGLKENDGALDGWIAHGSTELANMLLHGHPAPVYARTLSPAHQQAEVTHEQEAQPELQASQDVTLPQPMSLELYQRGMQAEQHQEVQQELDDECFCSSAESGQR